MVPEANKVSVIVRISGSYIDVATHVPALDALEGYVTRRPERIPSEALPEAWWATEMIRCNVESTEPLISDILDSLEPVLDVFSSIAGDPRFRVAVQCTIEITVDRPLIEVSARTLRRLAELTVTLGFEVFDYRE